MEEARGETNQPLAQRKNSLREALSRFPRVPLVTVPTPLHHATRLSKELGGPRILIKREDLAGFPFGGSKYRSLEFSLGDAVSRGADVIVCCGMGTSNHPQQAAAACARLGLPIVILIGDARGHLEWQGNLLLEKLSGAEIRFLPSAGYKEIIAAQEATAERLRREGRKPAFVCLTPETDRFTSLAFVNYMLELLEQVEREGIDVDRLYVGSGGPTFSGMLLGSQLLGFPRQVVGVTPLGNEEEARARVASLVQRVMDSLGMSVNIASDRWSVTDRFVGLSHGVLTAAAREAIRLVASTEGIFLDPVYSGKAMAGLIEHVRNGRISPDETMVFAHTGGMPALFSYAEDFASASPLAD